DLEHSVNAWAMEGAARLVAYFKSHARKVYAALDADPRVADARHVLKWLEDRPDLAEFSRRDVHQGLKGGARVNRPESLDAPLELLERHGYIRSLLNEHRSGPGRRASDRYQRNPLWGGAQYSQNAQNGLGEGHSEHSEHFEEAGDAW